MSKYLLYIVIGLFVINCIWFLATSSLYFTHKYNHAAMSTLYSNSQYVKGSGSAGIGDDGLYAFSGFYYITGGDPSQVNFENPPLGKYLIGLSELIFHNENVINILYAAVICWVVYKLSMSFFKSKLMSWLTLLVMVADPFFQIQLILPLLDLPLATFFLLGIYFYLKGLEKPRYYWAASFFWGVANTIKFFPFIVVLVLITLIHLFMINKSHLKTYVPTLILLPLIYFASYSMYFLYHPSMLEFLRFQKWIIHWRTGNPIVLGNIFLSVFLGRYKAWYPHKGLVENVNWTVHLPILIGLGMISPVFFKHAQNRKQVLQFLYLVAIVFMLYLAILTVGIRGYVLVAYPIWVILAIYTVSSIFAILGKWRKPRLIRKT